MFRNATLGVALLFCALMLGSSSVKAAMDTYTFSHGSGTYSPVSGGTNHYIHPFNNGNVAVSLPFSFTYDGVSYTGLNVSTDGYVTFGGGVNSFTPFNTGTLPTIAAFATDLESTTGSVVRSGSSGQTGARVFTIEWSGLRRTPAATTLDSYTFQIRLHETSNRIEIVYGNMNARSIYGAQIGIRGTSTTDVRSVEVNYNSNTWTTPYLRSTSSRSYVENSWAPASGYTYTFRPRITNDVGILSLTSPMGFFNPGASQNIMVTVRNHGSNSIDSMIISWSINGVAQVPVRYYPQPALIAGESRTISIGFATFAAGSFNTISIGTSMPNGVVDANNSNDSYTGYLAPRVNGTIRVAQFGNPGVYNKIRDVVRHLVNSGMNGNVDVMIRNGTYHEQLPFVGIENSGYALNVMAEDGNDAVNLTFDVHNGNRIAASNERGYILLIDGMSSLNIAGLGFMPSSASQRNRAISFDGSSSKNIEIHDCSFTGQASIFDNLTGSMLGSGIYVFGGGFSDSRIHHNSFNTFEAAIYNAYDGWGNSFNHNMGSNLTHAGAYMLGQDNLDISHNDFQMRVDNANWSYGIVVSGYPNARITNNIIVMRHTANSAYAIIYESYYGYYSGSASLIANNMISMSGAASSMYGIYSYIEDQSDLNVYHNTVNIAVSTSTAALNVCFVGYATSYYSGYGYRIVNNIFHNAGTTPTNGGWVYELRDSWGYSWTPTSNPILASDFNNLMTTGANIGSWNGTTIARQAGANPLGPVVSPPSNTWRGATRKDYNSVSKGVTFVGGTDLHLLNVDQALWGSNTITSIIRTDIDGDTRVKPYMGADEVAPSVRIVAQPESRFACLGENIQFVVLADITPGAIVKYQWYKDGIEILGQTNALMNITSVGYLASGVYTCNIMVSDGSYELSVWTDPASLIIVRSTDIISHPQSQPVAEGGEVYMMISAEAVGSPANYVHGYQWKRRKWNTVAGRYDTTNVVDDGRITGSQSNILTIRNIGSADTSGTYLCEVIGYCGRATSHHARLFMPSVSATVINATPCIGQDLIIECSANPSSFPGGSAVYQWFKNNSPLTDGGRVNGTNGKVLRINVAESTESGSYACVVTYLPSGVDISSGTVQVVMSQLPTISVQPISLNSCVGEQVAFTVTASGNDLTYRWLKDNAEVPNARQATLAISSLSVADAGKYMLRVSNGCGAVVSQEVTLTVDVPPSITQQPKDAEVRADEPLTLSVASVGSSPITYKWFLNGLEIDGATEATYTVTNAKAEDAGTYYVEVSNECGKVNSMEVAVNVITTGVAGDIVDGGFKLGSAYPNPTTAQTAFVYAIPVTTQVRIVVTDVIGRVVAELVNGSVDAGEHPVPVNTNTLQPGVYNYSISTPGFNASNQFVVVR